MIVLIKDDLTGFLVPVLMVCHGTDINKSQIRRSKDGFQVD
jgi:hypothetical protein